MALGDGEWRGRSNDALETEATYEDSGVNGEERQGIGRIFTKV